MERIQKAEETARDYPVESGSEFRDVHNRLNYCVDTKRTRDESMIIGYLRERAAIDWAYTRAQQGHLSEARAYLVTARRRVHRLQSGLPKAGRAYYERLNQQISYVDDVIHAAQARAAIR